MTATTEGRVPGADRQTEERLLIGVEDIPLPKWAAADAAVANATLRQAVRSLPEAIRIVLRLAWQESPRLTLLAGLVHLLSGCVTAAGLLATADVFFALLADRPTPDRIAASLPAIAIVVVSYATRALLDTAVAAVEASLRPRVVRAADDAITAAVVGVDLLAHEDAEFRELARQGARRGVESMDTSLRQIADLISAGIAVLAAMVTTGFLNPWLPPMLLLAAIADGIAAVRIARLNYQHFIATLTRHFRHDAIEEAATRRELALERHALCLQDRLLSEFRAVVNSLMRCDIRLAHRSNMVRLAGRAAAGIGSGLAYVVLGTLLYVGQLELALAGTAVLAMRAAGSALGEAMRAVTYLYEDSFRLGYYTQLLEQAAERQGRRDGVTAPDDPAEIRLTDVSFTYPGQPEPALADINLTLRRGEVVALVGENGSGKSTLGKLITGLYPPTTGTVHWDNVDLAATDLRTVHDQIAIIAQNPAEWPMTARHNVIVGRLNRHDPDRAGWTHAINASGADEVIDGLPQGENTLLSRHFEGGRDLSGGQWQRLGVARGIFRAAHVLVADEPTAALDAKAEARVFDSLQSASLTTTGDLTRRTTVLVTHRLANVAHADRIIVLERGRIVECGTHAELLNTGGAYATLYDLQSRRYIQAERTIIRHSPSAVARSSRYHSVVDVMVLLRRDDGKVLLTERANTGYADGQLCPPGGHLEDGETVTEGALRETREEIGVEIDPKDLTFAHVLHYRSPEGTARIGFFFTATRWRGEPMNREPHKCARLIWTDPANPLTETVPYTALALANITAGASFATGGWKTTSRTSARHSHG